ncbi:MAG TPA: hypothetical protein VIY08_06760 [Candidatus Nitrosocosmicus sp.]
MKVLNDRTKAGRLPEVSEEVSFSIKKELSNSNQVGQQNRLKN